MLTLLVGAVLTRILVAGELRRTLRSGAPRDEQLKRLSGTGSIPTSLGLAMGLICAGEVLLEVPPLDRAWGLAGAMAALVLRLGLTAVWLDTIMEAHGRLSGSQQPWATTMVQNLRGLLVSRLPRYVAAGAGLQLLHQGLPGVQLAALYLLFSLAIVVLGPLITRLGRRTRATTPAETALVGRLTTSYGLGIDRVTVEVGGRTAYVAGIGRGARIFVGDEVLAGSEDELAAVLAHEVAHRDRNHVAWWTAITAGSAVAMVTLAVPLLRAAPDQGIDPVVGVLVVAVVLPLLRRALLAMLRVGQEYDADVFAARRVGAAALGRFLQRHDDRIPLGGRGSLRFRLRTGHPTLAERLAALDRIGTPAG